MDRFETVEIERVEHKQERRSTYSVKANCPKCKLPCHKFCGSSNWEGGPTPGRIKTARYAARKKQRQLYDPIENMPRLKAYYLPDS